MSVRIISLKRVVESPLHPRRRFEGNPGGNRAGRRPPAQTRRAQNASRRPAQSTRDRVADPLPTGAVRRPPPEPKGWTHRSRKQSKGSKFAKARMAQHAKDEGSTHALAVAKAWRELWWNLALFFVLMNIYAAIVWKVGHASDRSNIKVGE